MEEMCFGRHRLSALAGGFAPVAVEAKGARGFRRPSATGSSELPAHDLAATRRGGQIGARASTGASS
jgi:hypothetical protein